MNIHTHFRGTLTYSKEQQRWNGTMAKIALILSFITFSTDYICQKNQEIETITETERQNVREKLENKKLPFYSPIITAKMIQELKI